MNSSSTDQLAAALPVLGLDVAKATVQAELRTNGNKMRFGFANNARGFAQLARILKERNLTKVWAGLEATGPYSHALALWLHSQGKEGNRYLRKALYMPALVAIKYNAPLCHFASRLRAAGKPKMSIVCAIMRKLLHIALGVLKHQKPFNPSLV